MIPARKGRLFGWWFARDARARIERTFGAIHVRGLEELREALARGPVLAVSNHTAWWDALLVVHLAHHALSADVYAMMEAKNLERLPFFGKVGAFGVRTDDPADGAAGIRYAAKLLDRPGRLVWIFAQGREVPITARPLGFRGGAGHVARVAKRARVVTVALRYEHGARPEPEIWLSFDVADTERGAPAAITAALEAKVTASLDGIDAAIAGRGADFSALYTKRPSALFRLAEAALAWLTRPRALAPRQG